MRRMRVDQQRLGLLPGAAAILLDVPVVRADIVEEPAPLVGVGDQPAERDDRGRSGSAPCRCRTRCGGFRSFQASCMLPINGVGVCVAAGYGSFDCLFHDGRQRLAGDCGRRRPAMAGRRRVIADIGTEDREIEREMREDMGDAAGEAASRRQRAAASAPTAPSWRAVQSVVGTSVMPPSRPLSARLRSSMAPSPRTATKAAPTRCGLSALGALDREAFGIAEPQSPRNRRCSGQSMQRRLARRADRRAQIHHRLGEIARPRCRHQRLDDARGSRGLAAGSGVSIASSREITRSTLPSTTAAGRSKAIAAIAAAV